MSWQITWRDGSQIRKNDAPSAAQVLRAIRQALQEQASDISVTKQPPERDLGGVPFPEIISALKKEKNRTVVPFLGAGVPFSGRSAGAEWTRDSPFLPSGTELARHLAFLCDLPIWNIRDTDNLARVASYYTITNPGADLADELRTVFAKGAPTPVHTLLAEPSLHPMLLVTTNYDTLMEQALDEQKVKYDTVIHCTDIGHRGSVLVKKHGSTTSEFLKPTDFYADLNEVTVLYKMHGSISPEVTPPQTSTANFVITEEDYVSFLSRLSSAPPVVPPLIRQHFRRSSFLFLGYSLEDWNVRVILDNLNDVMSDSPGGQRRPNGNVIITPNDSLAASVGPLESAPAPALGDPGPMSLNPVAAQLQQGADPFRRHWAIQYRPTTYDVEVWKGRNVVVRNMDLNDFVTELRKPQRGLFPRGQ